MGLPGGFGSQFPVKNSYLCFIRSLQNHLSRHHAIISYFSRLPYRKIKKFPVSWVYLIPFPAISKPIFPISRPKKWRIPHPEKALLGPHIENYVSYFVDFSDLKTICTYLITIILTTMNSQHSYKHFIRQ